MSTVPWTAYDEGYLRAYEWAGALAGGAQLPVEAPTLPLGPGEVAHSRFAQVAVSGFFGEQREYRSSFFLVGGPVGLAVTGAASLAHNSAKKAEAQRAAIPRWHALGSTDVVVTSQRLVAATSGQGGSLSYAELGPLQLATGTRGVPAVQFQAAGQPMLRLESPWVPLLYVFVHHLVDGRPPGVPVPPGLLERARADGSASVARDAGADGQVPAGRGSVAYAAGWTQFRFQLSTVAVRRPFASNVAWPTSCTSRFGAVPGRPMRWIVLTYVCTRRDGDAVSFCVMPRRPHRAPA